MKTKVYVARGRTVIGDGGVKYGPGEEVSFYREEVERLKALGFVQSEPPILTPPAELNPGNVGLQHRNAQGPQFRR